MKTISDDIVYIYYSLQFDLINNLYYVVILAKRAPINRWTNETPFAIDSLMCWLSANPQFFDSANLEVVQ